MALSTSTNAGFPKNIPGTLVKATTNPVVDNVFVLQDGAEKWERVFDSGEKTFYASWLKHSSAPADLTTLINVALADARVKIFVVDSDITINSTVEAGGKVVEFVSGVVNGTGIINNADIRARWTYTFLGGTVTLTNCVFSSYTPRFANDTEANEKNIIYYYNTTTSKQRFKNGSTWYDVLTSIAQVTANSLQGDGSVGSPIQLDNDADAPGNNRYYGTNASGTKGFHSLPATSNAITTGDSLSGDGTVGTPAKLLNDAASPGNNQYYGTNASGTKGWYSNLVITADSLQGDGTAASPVKLDNDNNAPGNNKVYATDGSGVKGWRDFPAASSTINTTESLTGDGSIGTPAKLVGDAASPGNSKYYGTDTGGTKGYHSLPAIVVSTTNSLNGDGSGGSPIQLDGDSNAPGNNYYYGTDGSGSKGFYTLPSIQITTGDSLQGVGTVGDPVKLDNDAASPGNNKVYGTDGSGAKGWRDFPANTSTIYSSMSLNGDGSIGDPVKLDGDNDTPGNSKYYGTNSGGTKGFYDITVSVTHSLDGTGASGSPLQLDGDSASPGNDKVYGTNSGGTKGWRDFPTPTVTSTNSLNGDGSPGSPLQLDGDNNAPGNSKYYGTNGSGTKGFYDLPAGGSTVTTADSLNGDGSGGSPIRLDGDDNAPGATKYYGTNGAGTKGFYSLPTVDGSETKVNAGANISVTGSGTIGSPYVIAGTYSATVQNSIEGNGGGSPLQLVGDSAAPGGSRYYGTNSGGTKGFYSLPTIAVTSSNSITGDGQSGTPVQLVGDAASPGTSRYYGTNGAGTKGYHSLPVPDGSETKVSAGANMSISGSGTTVSPYVFAASFAAASTNSIQGNGTGGNQLQLVGDTASPGASRYYGTNSGGTKGFHAIPVYDGSETKINAGTNVTVTGSGTVGSPYVINSAGNVLTQKDYPVVQGSWQVALDNATGSAVSEVLRVGHATDPNYRTITLSGVYYLAASSFSYGVWTTVANLPSGYRPSVALNFPIASYGFGADYEDQSGSPFYLDWKYISGGIKILANGDVQVNITNESQLKVVKRTGDNIDHVLVPINATYFIHGIGAGPH